VPKTVIHVFHDDDHSIATGTRVAQRIQEVAPDRGCSVEVFCFGPAQRRLSEGDTSEASAAYNRQIDELIADDVRPALMEPRWNSHVAGSTCRWPETSFCASHSNRPPLSLSKP
jgi:hypothetical protein